jgi:hypothetical protein
MQNLPEVNHAQIPGSLAMFIRALRSGWQRRILGIPDKMQKAVTFQDLVDMNVVEYGVAKRQAEK